MRVCNDTRSNVDVAIATCTTVIQSGHPDKRTLALAFYDRGCHYARKSDSSRAIKDFDRAIQLLPDYLAAITNRGTMYGNSGDWTRAMRDYDEAARIDPNDPIVLMNRGTAYSKLGDHVRAVAQYDRVIALDPGHYPALNGRCWNRAIVGKDLKGALADCNAALAISPKDANTLNSRGFVEFRLKQFNDAIGDYNAAITADPHQPSSYYVRGLAKRALGDIKGGNLDIAKAETIDPTVAKRVASYGITL
jgi:tetratricopeptide (TPR) repeat protein